MVAHPPPDNSTTGTTLYTTLYSKPSVYTLQFTVDRDITAMTTCKNWTCTENWKGNIVTKQVSSNEKKQNTIPLKIVTSRILIKGNNYGHDMTLIN